MSFTLRGRVDTRLAAALVPVAAACVWAALAQRLWPVELAALMVAVGLVFDVLVWDRLDYQPGWAALPLGAVELAAVMGLVRALGIDAPLRPALLLFAAAWLVGQILAHAGLPLLRLSYAEDGGELGRAGAPVGAAAVALVAGASLVAWAGRPPAVHLAAGVHRGPLVIRRAETLVGEPGAVVVGGIVVRTNDVTVRDVAVLGGENGIDVEGARNVRLERVRVAGARLDGIHVRNGTVDVRDCRVQTPTADGQGIDISFAASRGMSSVRGCRVSGGQDGIVAHDAAVHVSENAVSGTTTHAISVTEMSMGSVERNRVTGATGVGIYCGDSSQCEIERNVVGDVRPDPSGDPTRAGYAIEAHYGASATLRGNRARRIGVFLHAEIRRG